MRLDRGWPEIRSKSYWNRLLIDFCDSISAVRTIVATISIQIRNEINQIWTDIICKLSIYIKNVSNLIEKGQI